jgi:hypothetical protein
MAFKDKSEFEADREDESQTGAFPLESADMESSDEEPPDDDELSEDELADEMKPTTLVQWKDEFPDYTAEEFEEKIPESPRARRIALVASCLMGTLLGAATAGVLVNDQPEAQQTRAFFIFFLVLAPLFSCLWHWLFYLRGEQLAQKMKKQEANPVGSEPILPNEGLQQEDPIGSEPIHPK